MVEKKKKAQSAENHTKHKNIQQGIVTNYCHKMSAYMKVYKW